MSIKNNFNVYSIPTKQAKPWILKKHYAGRMPSVSYAFGLHRGKELVGVCTFGHMSMPQEEQRWKPFQLYELNRLITEDDLPKNALSYFVSQCIKKLPKPCVLISYADLNNGHHGYIYQATNWIYTGLGAKGIKSYIMNDGTVKHSRHDDKINMNEVKEVKKSKQGKARYYYFVGNKREKRKMKNKFRKRKHLEKKPYPKGDNEEYDTGEKLHKQQRLF